MEKKFNFELTQAEANLVINALGDRPYKQTVALITSMQLQYAKQKETDKKS